MSVKVKFNFSSKLWQHQHKGGWYFISLPAEISSEIRNTFKHHEEGWGRLKVTAQINTLKWQTSIWFDTKHKVYLLPIKSEIRKKLNLKIDELISLIVYI